MRKPLFAAALAPFGFSRCVGIELLRGLYQAAVATRALLHGDTTAGDAVAGATAADALADGEAVDAERTRALVASVAKRAAPIELRCDSFLSADNAWWIDADIVYASSICLTDDIMHDLAARMRRVRPGTLVITLKMLPGGAEPEFEVVHSGWYRMSWGRTGVWILRRTDFVS